MDREGSEGFENLQENICNFLEWYWAWCGEPGEHRAAGFALRAAGQILLCLPLYMTHHSQTPHTVGLKKKEKNE